MNKLLFPFRKRQSGQSLVEFGLTLMVILLLLSGAIDFGMGYFSFVAVRDAAQEGALFGSIKAATVVTDNGVLDPGEILNTTAIQNRVRASSQTPVKLQDLTNSEISVVANTPCEGHLMTVSITYNYHFFTALIGVLFPSGIIPITVSSTSTILYPACP